MIAIIGGGLAGTSLAKLLDEKNNKFDWYLDHTKAASHISSGILNPITGRRYAITWKYEELVAIAKSFYGDFLHPISLEKHFTPFKDGSSIEDINRGKENYLTKINENWIEVKACYQFQTSAFMSRYQKLVAENHSVMDESFTYADLVPNGSQWIYKGRSYRQVLFAEGIFVQNNPFFEYLDFKPNRGEALLIDIFKNKPNKVRKHGKFICPYKEQFWVGSSFDKVDFQAPLTTEKAKQDLLDALPNLIEGNEYHVAEHVGALRSTTYDRRPIIGEHPDHKGLYIFNGFGAKGASLIPWCAFQMLNNIVDRKTLNAEIDIARITRGA